MLGMDHRTDEEKLHDFLDENYEKEMPHIISYLDRTVNVSCLVDLISGVMEMAAIKSISVQSMKDVKLGLLALIEEVYSDANGSSIRDEVLSATQEASMLRGKLSELKQEKSALLELQEKHLKELESQQSDIDDLLEQRNQLNSRLGTIRSNFEDQISKEKAKQEKMIDQLQELRNELDQSRKNEKFLKKEIKGLNRDLEAMTKAYQKLHKKLDVKDTEVDILKQELRTTEIKTESTLFSTTDIFADTSGDIEKKLVKTKKQLKSALQISESQADDLHVLGAERGRVVPLLKRQMELLDEYEDRLTMAEEDLCQDRILIDKLETKVGALESSCESLETDLTAKSAECTEIRDKLNTIISEIGVPLTEAVEWIKDRKQQLDPELARKYERLASAVRGLVHLIESLLSHDSHPFIDNRPLPILEDLSLKGTIVAYLSEIKNLQKKNDMSGFDTFEKIFVDRKRTEELVDAMIQEDRCGEFAVVAGVCAANKCLVDNYRDMAQRFATLHSLVPKEHRSENKLASIEEFMKELTAIYSKLISFMSAVRFNGKRRTNSFEEIKQYISEVHDVYKSNEFELRSLDDNTSSCELPKAAKKRIADLENELSRTRSEMDETVRSVVEDLEKHHQSLDEQSPASPELDNLTEKISQLSDDLKMRDASLEEMRLQLREALESKSEIEKALATFHETRLQNAEKLRIAQTEKDRLMRSLESRSESFTKRIREAIDQERKRHETELDSQLRRSNDQVVLITNKLEAKKKKLRAVTERAKELADTCQNLLSEKDLTIQSLTSALERKKAKIANLKIELSSSTPVSISKLDMSSASSSSTTPTAVPSGTPDNDRFVAQLGRIISKCAPMYEGSGWTRSRVLSAISAMADKLYVDLEKPQPVPRSPPRSPTGRRESFDWRRWAQSVASPRSNLTDEQLQTLIRDTVIASSEAKTVATLSSLRQQKKVLMNPFYANASKRSNTQTLKSLITATFFLRKLAETASSKKRRYTRRQ